jgi:hypothetical protein
LLLNEVMELVRARCDRNEWVDLIEPR